jgi:protease I
MKSALLVIAPTMFRDEEYAEPKRILERRGARVTTASLSAGECTGKLGMRAVAEISLADAVSMRWDSVTFVGGGGAQVYFDDRDAHALAHRVREQGGIVSAICIAPSVLARAGLLAGVRATAFPSQEADLRAHGAVWTSEPVTVDGTILTGNGPEAAAEFGSALADLLGLPDEEERT